MKLVLRDYISSMKERDELDVLIQNLLSKMGLNIVLIPRKGVKEHGVDIEAVGCWPEETEEKLFLFAIKSGNITRSNWSGNSQTLKESIEEIIYSFIPSHILPEHKNKKIVVCPCFGGYVDKSVAVYYKGFFETLEDRNPNIEFKTIDLDVLSELILGYLFNEKLLPKRAQKEFLKSLSYVSDADITYKHFCSLLRITFQIYPPNNHKDALDKARMLYISLAILFSNAKDEGYLLGVVKCSELAILVIWENIKKYIESDKNLIEIYTQLCMLHVSILKYLYVQLFPYSRHFLALSHSVTNDNGFLNYGCISLRLTEILGLVSSLGIWLLWIKEQLIHNVVNQGTVEKFNTEISNLNCFTKEVIKNNPICFTPIQDEQCSDLLVLFDFWIQIGETAFLSYFLSRWCDLTFFTLMRRNYYTSNTRGLKEFIKLEYKRNKGITDEDFEKSTNSLATVAYISLLGKILGFLEVSLKIDEITTKLLRHTDFQIYMFDDSTEDNLYLDKKPHGLVLTGVSISSTKKELEEAIWGSFDDQCKILSSLSCVRHGFTPIVYVACRHYKLPLPYAFLLQHKQMLSTEKV